MEFDRKSPYSRFAPALVEVSLKVLLVFHANCTFIVRSSWPLVATRILGC
jgi:hypothetical protein